MNCAVCARLSLSSQLRAGKVPPPFCRCAPTNLPVFCIVNRMTWLRTLTAPLTPPVISLRANYLHTARCRCQSGNDRYNDRQSLIGQWLIGHLLRHKESPIRGHINICLCVRG